MVYKSKTPSCNCHTLSADDLYCCAETIPAVIGFVPFRDQLEYNSIRNLNVHDSRPSEALLSVALSPVLSARDGDAYLPGATPNSNCVRSSISPVPHSTPSRCVYDEQKCNNAVMPTVHSHWTSDYLQFGAQPDPLPCEAVRWWWNAYGEVHNGIQKLGLLDINCRENLRATGGLAQLPIV